MERLKHPQLARGDRIVAVPALVRKVAAPTWEIVGDRSDTERVLVDLELQPPASERA